VSGAASSAPRGVLLAGLPDGVAGWLARHLAGAHVQAAHGAAEVRDALAGEGWGLAIVDDAFPGAREVLAAAAGRVPVFYCVPGGAEAGLTRDGLDRLGVSRVFYHPLDREELAREAASALGTRAETVREAPERGSVAAAVAQAWERFRGAVVARVDAVEAAAVAVLEGTLDAETRRHAEREAHKLAGSVGTFGFAQGSRLARELEMLLTGSAPLGQAEALKLTDLAVALRRELAKPPSLGAAPAAAPAQTKGGGGAELPLLLVVDDDGELAQRIAMEASGRGMRARVAADPGAARAVVAEDPPAAVLLDLSFGGDASGLELLAELSSRTPAIPVIVLTARTAFTDRVEVARLGGQGFLQKPIPPAAAVEAVRQLLRRDRAAKGSVLAVDDDPQILAAVSAALAPQGLEVETVDDPLRFWEALEASTPDMVVMDVDMPHVNGIELCRVMRNDGRWTSVPIVFLTARTDPETVQRIFAAGADDYVAKPIVGPELVTRVANRMERVRLHRSLAETDPLTGASNRRRSEELMGQLLHLAARQQQPFSLGILDLDHFKGVNDRFGHGTGDDVLRRVSRLLQKSFRAEDVVARWGGEEFVVGMYGMDKDDGVQRLADVLETLREQEFEGLPGEEFRVSFSGGVAHYPEDGGDLQTLYRAADAALYMAKENGRDRVLPAGWTPDRPGAADTVDVLVVEDDPAIARLLMHALETRGYGSRWIPDGGEAASLLTGSRPALRARVILLDVDLPGMDGHALLRLMARERVLERTRVIVLTVRSHEAEVVQSLEEGAFDHVAKPFSVPILLQRIRRAMRG
jgi:diguanylate cyclase (GGDEF)-like protein